MIRFAQKSSSPDGPIHGFRVAGTCFDLCEKEAHDKRKDYVNDVITLCLLIARGVKCYSMPVVKLLHAPLCDVTQEPGLHSAHDDNEANSHVRSRCFVRLMT